MEKEGVAPERARELDPRVEDEVRSSLHRCPFCHEAVAVAEDAWTACEGCLARHHEACWREGGRCGACGHQAALSRTSVSQGRSAGSRALRAGLALASLLLVVLGLALGLGASSGEDPTATTEPQRRDASETARSRSHPSLGGALLVDRAFADGLYVERVFVGTPGAQVFAEGDVVESVDGRPVRDLSELARRLAGRGSGDVVRVGLSRLGGRDRRTWEVPVVELLPPRSGAAGEDALARIRERLGAEISDVGDVLRVHRVFVGTPASGVLQDGDVLESLDGHPLRGAQDLDRLLAERAPGADVRLGVSRRDGADRRTWSLRLN